MPKHPSIDPGNYNSGPNGPLILAVLAIIIGGASFVSQVVELLSR